MTNEYAIWFNINERQIWITMYIWSCWVKKRTYTKTSQDLNSEDMYRTCENHSFIILWTQPAWGRALWRAHFYKPPLHSTQVKRKLTHNQNIQLIKLKKNRNILLYLTCNSRWQTHRFIWLLKQMKKRNCNVHKLPIF